ncbi:MAG: phosphomethylpyrimidine synthase ThiC [Lentisphaerae bacterium]|nr:phosphomethylpyrimidine synthase ThiC [Lentisphaerota bacterium]OQC16939.1 MAG: Phosphomethylpyrimidine synthase [Lentisphaerae bacterium ADurb.Bin082]HQL86569.1 phosphomethylpyrimidine synthase ThiC [Lentisphaeria bacterium]
MSSEKLVTQMQCAAAGEITPAIAQVAASEYRQPEEIRAGVAAGTIVIPANVNHRHLRPIGIGRLLRTKINANIGNSSLSSCPRQELEKLQHALRYGADTVMDLSTGSNIAGIRQKIVQNSPAPIGTVPVYETLARAGGADELDEKLILEVIREQAEQGVDYMTIHAGILYDHIDLAKKRLLRIVSRGGSILARWMRQNNRENPYYTRFDEILDICQQHDVTLSLGDGMRPGCLADASDDAQFAELKTLGELVRRCRAAGVQAMVEGPGHIPFNQIEMNMKREIELCDDAPFYILGPVVVDCAPGYDHITSAIGATMGAFHGASMLCYVTPKEHLGLPNAEDVRNGVIAYKIAAHAADVALGRPHARDRDDAISRARADFDWERQFELALDPERARSLRAEALAESGKPADHDERAQYCTMCGPDFCSMRISKEL